MEKIKNFRDLDVWKLGIEIVNEVYSLTKSFPKEEIYGLVSQIRGLRFPFHPMWQKGLIGITTRNIDNFYS